MKNLFGQKSISMMIAAILAIFITGGTSLYASNTDYVTRNFKFSHIESIKAGSIFNIEVTEGSSNNVTLRCPKSMEKYVSLKWVNGTLICSFQSPKKNYRIKDEKITVKLQMKNIANIKLGGASKLVLNGNFTARNDMNIVLSGAANISGIHTVTGSNLNIEATGASHVKINGSFKYATAIISGAARLQAKGKIGFTSVSTSGAAGFSYDGAYTGQTLCIKSSGASEVYMYGRSGKNETITAESQGASSITLKGNTNRVEFTSSGSSSINSKELTARSGKATASGPSKITVYATDKLALTSSSVSASIRYYGNPKVLDVDAYETRKTTTIKEGY